MRKPELSDYKLTQVQVDWALAAKDRRVALEASGKAHLIAWSLATSVYALLVFFVGHLIKPSDPKLAEGIFTFATVCCLLPIGLIKIFMEEPCRPVINSLITTLFDEKWGKISVLVKDNLERHTHFLAATKIYEADLARQKKELLRQMESYWTNLSGKAFEKELADLFTRVGYQVELTQYTRDGGVDIKLRSAGKLTIVQCKRYSKSVGVAAARELYGVLQSEGADKAMLATTGSFTQGVRDFIAGKPIELLGLQRIIELHALAKKSV